MIFRVVVKQCVRWRVDPRWFSIGSLLSVPAHAHAMEVFATRHFYVGIAVLLLLQTTLIGILMIQNHRHRRAQDAAQRQQSEVTHAARLVLVGEMTASIAHEVSQPLSAILSNADAAEMLLQADPVPLEEIRHILDDIRRDDLRAHEIVRNLRKLLAKRELRMERIDINEIARTALSLSRSDAMRRGIVIRTALDQDLPMASGDPVHLQQVMLNLIINAMDSLKEIPVNERHIEVQTRRHGAKSVEVSVVDTGSGIPGDHVSRVFDSFYTTKQDGMGLGLSIARAIVQTHGGAIWAENNKIGHGANFKFTIPVAA
jgi:signal transduction histidine kinase